jgi:hypothetical protein
MNAFPLTIDLGRTSKSDKGDSGISFEPVCHLNFELENHHEDQIKAGIY